MYKFGTAKRRPNNKIQLTSGFRGCRKEGNVKCPSNNIHNANLAEFKKNSELNLLPDSKQSTFICPCCICFSLSFHKTISPSHLIDSYAFFSMRYSGCRETNFSMVQYIVVVCYFETSLSCKLLVRVREFIVVGVKSTRHEVHHLILECETGPFYEQRKCSVSLLVTKRTFSKIFITNNAKS